MVYLNIFLAVLLLLFSNKVYSYPKGAGACLSGRKSVIGLHNFRGFYRPRKVISKTLTAANVVVQISGIPMEDGEEYSLATNVPYKILVTGKDIKGILIRAETENQVYAKDALTQGKNTRIAQICSTSFTGPHVTGLSHINNKKKSDLEGTIQFDEKVEVYIDITVVFYNEYWKGASHAYGQIKISFDGIEPTSPVSVPVAPTSPVTVSSPTSVPVAPASPGTASSPTSVPVAVSSPTAVPGVVLTNAPS